LIKKAAGEGKKNSSTGKEMEVKEILSQPLGVRQFDAKHEAQLKANAIKNKYVRTVEKGEDKTDAAKVYRDERRELMDSVAKQKVVGLKLDDTVPKADKEVEGEAAKKKKSSSLLSPVRLKL
jgi:hypothetical protein